MFPLQGTPLIIGILSFKLHQLTLPQCVIDSSYGGVESGRLAVEFTAVVDLEVRYSSSMTKLSPLYSNNLSHPTLCTISVKILYPLAYVDLKLEACRLESFSQSEQNLQGIVVQACDLHSFEEPINQIIVNHIAIPRLSRASQLGTKFKDVFKTVKEMLSSALFSEWVQVSGLNNGIDLFIIIFRT
ncbi:hypothetical protein WICPIJ_004631 [Wickerhamomyces pijperi]|uniref:Uncharacterized protein n=1 Tax=Wickerhamomyces pijperi TaxID=599730 RepID=A0A9P8Q5C5_WICPI|nr:hypothetical protein WICPIJ_004631 [Wickerhamomyces pijperi]